MKAKNILIICGAALAAMVVCFAIFFSADAGKIETLYNDAVKALDNEKGLKELFLDKAVNESETLNEDIAEVNKFYRGKMVSISDFKVFRESGTEYRAYGYVKTTEDEYFVCIAATGARRVDKLGIRQFIIEDAREFRNKKIFEKKELGKYEDHAKEFGATVRFTDKGVTKKLFNRAVSALDNEGDFKDLFTEKAVIRAKTFDKDIKVVNDFFKGKTVEINELKSDREKDSNFYRAFGYVKTDEGEYFVCVSVALAKQFGDIGIQKLVVEDAGQFRSKNIVRKDDLEKYMNNAKDYGATVFAAPEPPTNKPKA